ncbi:nucleoside diphosphate kinase domain protein [Ostertagia ostertagi]
MVLGKGIGPSASKADFHGGGATNPLASAPGTIRGDYCIQTGRNICHGSDSIESAQREIAHWFKPEEINDYDSRHINSGD